MNSHAKFGSRFGRGIFRLAAAGGAAIVAGAALLALPGAGRAEIQLAHKYKKPEVSATALPFTKTDFINVVREPMARDTFAVGEPVSVPLRVINHTQFKASVMTNLNAQSNLQVQIRKIKPEMGTAREYHGPFSPGNYTPGPIVLYPLEEFPVTAIIWGDRETDSGLAFPEPGEYAVRVSLRLSADLSTVNGTLPTEPFVVKIVAPEGPDAEIVKALAEKKGFVDLHLRKIPEGMRDQFKTWVESQPQAKMTPYLAHTLGMAHYQEMGQAADPKPDYALAQKYFEITARADTPFRADAWEDIFHTCDKMVDSSAAKRAAQEAIKALPPEVAARKGSVAEFRKYLINSAEMDPTIYWDLMK